MNRRILHILTFLLIPLSAVAQNIKEERSVHQIILKEIKKDIQKNYYDPNFRGIDLEANYKKTSELIDNAASSTEMSDLIGRFCLLLDDSHTIFSPPRKTYGVDYGWNLLLIDNKAFVTEISEKSDAYKKGVRVGDQVYMIEGFIPNRSEFRTLMRHFNVMQPRRSLDILLVKPSGNKYKLDIAAEITENSKFLAPTRRDWELEYQKYDAEYNRQIYYGKIPGLSILKMTSFDLSTIKVDKMIDKVEKNEALILDLRGNRGGYNDALEQLVSNFFDREVDAGKIINRDGTKTFSIKSKGKKAYKGKLVVLIDNGSSSAAEIFARIVQLEKRGIVIGDQSAGAVMQSVYIPHSLGAGAVLFYGINMTIADLIMSDGQRLEKVGVTPDKKIFPTAQDLANKRDPVISRAAEILGFKISPEEAGKIFNSEYKK